METLTLQLDIARSLLDSLDRMTSVCNNLTSTYQTQSEVISQTIAEIRRIDQESQTTSRNANSLNREVLNSIQVNSLSQQRHVAQSQQIQNEIQNGVSDSQRSNQTTSTAVNNTLANAEQGAQKLVGMDSQIKDAKKTAKKGKDAAKKNEELVEKLEESTVATENTKTMVNILNDMKNAVITGGVSLLMKIPELIFGFFKMAASMFTTALSSMSKFAMFSMTLPFTIAKALSSVGNKLRQDLAMLKEAGEEAKQSFDLTSRIGKGAAKLTKFAQNSIKSFDTPESRLSELYGMGAQAGASLQKESFAAVDAMGHFSEVYGGMMLGNSKYALQLIQLQKGLGVSAQDMAYYALQAYNSGTNPVNALHDIKNTIESVADQTGLDFKQLAAGFHKLRTNITEFGHLTNNEVGNLIGKLRGMKVKVEDAVNVFKKFTSFEEAAKASAMMFQTFEMNIDAFDLLTARDPGEMLTQFRDAMFQTGKSFSDLSRHEKSLMASITGISEQGLTSLMNYMDLGLTKEEAQKLIEDQDPTKEQTKMIKGLSSVVKQLQKTLQFNGPFDAFFQGLAANAANQKDLKHSFISLSEVYESIRHLGFSLKLERVNTILRPITNMLISVHGLVCNDKFKNVLEGAVRAASDFFNDTAYRIQTNKNSKLFMFIGPKIAEFYKMKNSKNKDLMETIDKELLTMASATMNGAVNSLKDKGKLLEGLKKLNAIKEVKDKNNKVISYKFAAHITNEKIVDIFKVLNDKYASDKVTSDQINNFLSSYNLILDSHFSNKLAEETVKKLKESPNIRTDVGERITNLYTHLLGMFQKGKPQFEKFIDIGRTVMGSLVRGMLHGIAASLSVLNGGATLAYETLGLKMSEATKKDMLAKNKTPKTYTIADWIGIDETSAKQISLGLESEGIRFISNLKPLATFAGSLLSDMLSIFKDLATGIVDGISFMTHKKYESFGSVYRYAMRQAGYNPEYGSQKSSGIKGTDMLDLNKQLQKTDLKIDGEQDRDKTYGNYLQYFEQVKSSFQSGSPASNFLNDSDVKYLLGYIKNRKNFMTTLVGDENASDIIEDADQYKRSSALLEILNNALIVENTFPSSLEKTYSKDELSSIYDSLGQTPDSLASTLKLGVETSPNGIGTPFKSPAKFVNKYDDDASGLNVELLKHNKSISKFNDTGLAERLAEIEEAASMCMPGLAPVANVDDIVYEGPSILMTPDKHYVLNKKDHMFIGAKKDGYIDQLISSMSEKINVYKETLTSALTDVISSNKSIFKYDKEEASEYSRQLTLLIEGKTKNFVESSEANQLAVYEKSKCYIDQLISSMKDKASETITAEAVTFDINSANKEIENANAIIDDFMNEKSDMSFIEKEADGEDFVILFEKVKEVIAAYKNRKVVIDNTDVVFDV